MIGQIEKLPVSKKDVIGAADAIFGFLNHLVALTI
jgi:hypothetical protein